MYLLALLLTTRLTASAIALPKTLKPRDSAYGWVAAFAGTNCTPPTPAVQSIEMQVDTQCNAWAPASFTSPLGTIGVNWGSDDDRAGIVNFDTDSACTNMTGWRVATLNKGQMACFSMKAFGGPYGSWDFDYPGSANGYKE